jgi:peptidoglycan/xylan/chitin deacetylase (PgdA/CDA1 family)
VPFQIVVVSLLQKNTVKRSLYKSLSLLRIYEVFRFFHRHKGLILTYHGVLSKSDDLYTSRNCVDASMFDRQMEFIARHYKVVPLSTFVEWLSLDKKLPPFTAAITFDDGFRNNLTVALPILKKYHLSATVFLATSFVGSDEMGLWSERVDWLIDRARIASVRIVANGTEKSYLLHTKAEREVASDQIRGYLKTLPPKERECVVAQLAQQIDAQSQAVQTGSEGSVVDAQERYAFLNWEEVKAMARAGITFGSHTHTHPILTPLSEQEVNFEVARSRRLIGEQLGTECRFFSYPNGTQVDFGSREEKLLKKVGYHAAVTQIDGFNDANSDLMALRRINIARNEDFSFFLAKISGVWSLLNYFRNRFLLIGG